MSRYAMWFVAVGLVGVGCGGTSTSDTVDAGQHSDAGAVDSSAMDSGALSDAATMDGSLGTPFTFADGGTGCDYGSAASTAAASTLDLFGQITYFANGAVLPGGSYRVEYEDGCMKYSSDQGWTIHAYANGSNGWWIGSQSGDKDVMPSGTVGYAVGAGAFGAFADCVNANLALSPVTFDHNGGQLGVWLADSPYSDNVAGESGRNPKWRLIRIGACISGAD